MDSVSGRSIVIVASLQAAIAAVALSSSPTAALAAAAIGLLAVGRYAAVASFVATMGPGPKAGLRVFAGSAWMLGLVALAVAIAAVALRARPALPWAVAAAFAGPIGMSFLAFGSGIGALAAGHRAAARSGGRR
jgi:hypothetical protein